jgi:hypothetical protein
VLDIYLFEIQCAEEIGAYKIADELDRKLVKMASSNHRTVQKKIEKRFSSNPQFKGVDFSPSQSKFIVSATPSVSFKTRREIESVASPYKVSFRYSSKSIDDLYNEPFQSGEDIMLEQMMGEFPEGYIGDDDFDREPTDEEMRFTSEFPADDTEGDFDGLIEEMVLDDLKKRGVI